MIISKTLIIQCLKSFRGKEFEKQWDECLAEEEEELKKLEAERKKLGIDDVVVPEVPFSEV